MRISLSLSLQSIRQDGIGAAAQESTLEVTLENAEKIAEALALIAVTKCMAHIKQALENNPGLKI